MKLSLVDLQTGSSQPGDQNQEKEAFLIRSSTAPKTTKRFSSTSDSSDTFDYTVTVSRRRTCFSSSSPVAGLGDSSQSCKTSAKHWISKPHTCRASRREQCPGDNSRESELTSSGSIRRGRPRPLRQKQKQHERDRTKKINTSRSGSESHCSMCKGQRTRREQTDPPRCCLRLKFASSSMRISKTLSSSSPMRRKITAARFGSISPCALPASVDSAVVAQQRAVLKTAKQCERTRPSDLMFSRQKEHENNREPDYFVTSTGY